MSAVQTTYAERIGKAYAGLVANETTCDIDSRVCETVAGIGFGVAVTQGSADNGAVLGGAVAGFVGISVRDATLLSSDLDKYTRYANMGVLTRGDIWVTANADVVAGGTVYYVSATGLFDDAAGGNVGPVKGAVWMTTALSGALGIVRLSGALSDN